MFIYWICVCVFTLLQRWLLVIPGLHTIKVIILAAMLNNKVNLKRKMLEIGFSGESALFEGMLKMISAICREGFAVMKKLD